MNESPTRLRERGIGKESNTGLEDELGCQLNSARSTASQKGVADTDVPRRGNVVSTVADFAPISVQLEPASTVPQVRSGSAMKAGKSGLEKLGWFSRLKNSARSCKLIRSVIAVVL